MIEKTAESNRSGEAACLHLFLQFLSYRPISSQNEDRPFILIMNPPKGA